jgi:hypothetical protein
VTSEPWYTMSTDVRHGIRQPSALNLVRSFSFFTFHSVPNKYLISVAEVVFDRKMLLVTIENSESGGIAKETVIF